MGSLWSSFEPLLLLCSPFCLRRQGGLDHFMTIGQASYNFARGEAKSDWGTGMLQHSEFRKASATLAFVAPLQDSRVRVDACAAPADCQRLKGLGYHGRL